MNNTSATTGQATGSQTVISVLQDLSARCHDSELGYRRSAQDVSDSDLKQQFEQLANERSSMASELDRLIREQGGEPRWTEGSTLGAVHRMFTDLKSAITGRNRQAILAEVARGESAAEEAYDEALRQNLPAEVRRVIQEQHRRVRETRNRYRAMSGMGESSRYSGELAHQVSSGYGMTHYMSERPLMSGVVVFALGFVIGALAVSSMSMGSTGSSGYTSQRRNW